MNKKFFSKKVIIIAVVVIVVVGGVIFKMTRKANVEQEMYTVDRGDVIKLVTATGSVAPSSKIKLQTEVAGQVVEIKVKEGEAVGKGDLLFRLKSSDIEAQILSQQAAVASTKAKLAEAVAGPTVQEISLAERGVETAQTRLESSAAAVSDANKALENALAKADLQIQSKLTEFLSDLEDASTEANDAVNRLTDSLFDASGFLTFDTSNSQAQTDAIRTRSDARAALILIDRAWLEANTSPTVVNVTAQRQIMASHLVVVKTHLEKDVAVLNAAINVDSTTLATYKSNANTALSSIAAAMQELDDDQTGLDLQRRLNDVDILAAETTNNTAKNTFRTNQSLLAEALATLALKRAGTRVEVIAAQRALVDAENAKLIGLYTELGKRHFTAPVDGTITQIAVELGENLTPDQTVMLMNAKGNLEVMANISEIDIADLTIGDPVSITLDAFPDTDVWKGSVTAIQPAETVIDNVISYKTTIRFDQEDERLRPGMTANLDIETARQASVLRVPVRAVHQSSAGPYVEMYASNNVVRQVPVKIGVEGEDYTEVTDGLKEGDSVIVYRKQS